MFFFSVRRLFFSVVLLASLWGQAADAPGEREAMIVVLSFYGPVGRDAPGTYGYQTYKNSADRDNFPLPLSFALPTPAPKYGTPEYAQLQYRAALEHMKMIRSGGFDVMLFDMLPVPDFNPEKKREESLNGYNEPFYLYQMFPAWLKAGEQTGVKAGIFADVANQSTLYPQRRSVTAAEWDRILRHSLKNLPDSPALWKVNGKPGIIHFGTDIYYSRKEAPVSGDILPDGGWGQVLNKLRAEKMPFFFIADVRPHDKILAWDKIADGVYIFAPAAPASFMSAYQQDISGKFTIPYYWFVSSGYYRGGTAFTQPEFQRIHDTFMAAMKSGAKRMITLTWNDMGEDHDIWPSSNKGRCLLEVTRYYNEWFKSGRQPKIDEEKLMVCYPLRAPVQVSTTSPVWGDGKWVAPPFAPRAYYWSLLRQPRELVIAGVGKVKLSAGLSFGEIGKFAVGGAAGSVIPVTAAIDGQSVVLPEIKVTASEKDGGLQHRYIDLLDNTGGMVTGPAGKWDISKNDTLKAERQGTAVNFKTASAIHNWCYLRGVVQMSTLSADLRLVKLSYRGVVPKGMNMVCVLQQPGNVAYVYDNLPLPQADADTTVLVPLNWFKPASWSAKTALKIPEVTAINYVNIGVAGRTEKEESGRLELKEFSFRR